MNRFAFLLTVAMNWLSRLPHRRRNVCQVWLLLTVPLWIGTVAAEDQAEPSIESGTAFLNLDSRTFGGMQFWTDELVLQDFRIQRNAITGHYRLLDEKNVRRAWGKFDECVAELEKVKEERKIPPLKPRVILVLHGLIRTRDSMDELTSYLRRSGDFSVLNVSYASTRAKLADHASALAKVVQHLEGVQEVNFVGHSLGNLVIRHYLCDRDNGVHGDHTVPVVGRIVMLGPPNQGAEMARRFQDNAIFRTIWGVSGKQLAFDWDTLESCLAIPKCEFGIIAGGRGDEDGSNPLVAGDDDFVVSVEETRLPGANDFLVQPVAHSFIMDDKTVQESTLRFLQHGYFVAPEKRQPIEPAPSTVP